MTEAAAHLHNWYLPGCVAGTVLVLLLLIARLRLHPALGLAAAALGLGIASGMPLQKVPASFTAGVGNLMGHIAIILGMGAVLGNLLARSGGAAALGSALVEKCGPRGAPFALLLLGLVVGMPVFFEVGLVLLMPIVASAARRSRLPPILVGLPLLAGLSIMHGLVPPHPAALLAAAEYHADLGRTILWGLVVGIPAGILAGPVLGWILVGRRRRSAAGAAIAEKATVFSAQSAAMDDAAGEDAGPRHAASSAGPGLAAFVILLPIALIFVGSWADAMAAKGGAANQALHFIGYPDVALLVAALVGLVVLGPRIKTGANRERDLLRTVTHEAFGPIAGVLVILSAAGGLSGVLRDSGAAQATVALVEGAHLPPLVLAWLLAAVVRVSMGSATVAMAVASGVLAPLAGQSGLRPELLVLATGSGSLMLSHVNDSGFWLVQSLFRLEVKETLGTWSVLETVLSVAGLGATLLLSVFMH